MQRDSGQGGAHGGPGGSGRFRFRRRKGSNEVPREVVRGNGRSRLLVDDLNKYRSMFVRIYSSFWMIGGFALIIYMGHLYIWATVVVIQIFMTRELFTILRRTLEDKQLPGFMLLNWHFFFIAMLFVYGRMLSQRLVNTVSFGWYEGSFEGCTCGRYTYRVVLGPEENGSITLLKM